ncbi:ABC transporter substrate-binding protein [Martelella sp. HB161492]|uniref:ABC transporter substrate-binding protein n=1 Tax=Martelella sp. HB161492 TaxID=2720726 RepID=UPI0015909538|nr:ABC transporter substrate-binding protein [Martelella sp. HB161492]
MQKYRIIVPLALALMASASVASAETVLTVNSENTTTWVRNFNPFNQTSARYSTPDFIYEPLVIFNRIDGNKPVFRLAESYELADDLKSITFTLRPDLKWSDGEPLTAADIVFTYDYLKKFPALDATSIWGQLSSVEQVDARTVTFNLSAPNSLIANLIVAVPIVPEHVWSKIDDPVTFANENPVGSGPMTEITRFTPQVYEQCRNPNYWDNDTLKVDCLRFPQLADNPQTLSALADGTLDWATSFIPDIDNTFVKKDPEHNHYWLTPSSLVSFSFNLQAPDENNRKAFDNVDFRRAVSMMIDRQAIVDIAGYGYPIVNDDPADLGEVYKSFLNPEVKAKYGKYTTFDQAGAEALLDQAGFVDADGDGFRDNPDGSKISFSLEIPNGWTDWIDAVQIAIETMQAAGLDVKMATPEAAVWTSDLIDGKYDMTLNALAAAASPYFPYMRAFNPDDIGKSRFAAQRWQSPELMAVLDEYKQTKDQAKQKDLLDKAQMIVAEGFPVIPVYNSPAFYEYSTKRFTGWANADNPFVIPVVSNYNPARLLQLLALKPVAE